MENYKNNSPEVPKIPVEPTEVINENKSVPEATPEEVWLSYGQLGKQEGLPTSLLRNMDPTILEQLGGEMRVNKWRNTVPYYPASSIEAVKAYASGFSEIAKTMKLYTKMEILKLFKGIEKRWVKEVWYQILREKQDCQIRAKRSPSEITRTYYNEEIVDELKGIVEGRKAALPRADHVNYFTARDLSRLFKVERPSMQKWLNEARIITTTVVDEFNAIARGYKKEQLTEIEAVIDSGKILQERSRIDNLYATRTWGFIDPFEHKEDQGLGSGPQDSSTHDPEEDKWK